MWLDADNRYFGEAGVILTLPAGYKTLGPKLKDIHDKAIATMVRDVAHRFLSPANRTPTLVDHVLMFDAVGGRYLPDRAVLIADGMVRTRGASARSARPTGSIGVTTPCRRARP